jgi:simple sugar transport system substrate-binding protein
MALMRRTSLAALLALMLGGIGGARAAEPLKVGFVYVGPIGDHGYSYQHDQAVWRWKRRSATR